MGKRDIQPAPIEEFWYWINERHKIWIERNSGKGKPWSKDPIFQNYKFTNVFRELDKGTLTLRQMIPPNTSPDLVVFNIIWYRVFNWYQNAMFCKDYTELSKMILHRAHNGKKIFTSAHMTVGRIDQPKYQTMLDTCFRIYEERKEIVVSCNQSLESAFNWLLKQKYFGIGPFIAYEIVTDFRWYLGLLWSAPDKLTWVNIGPGCKRGLQRLRLLQTSISIRKLYELSRMNLHDILTSHFPKGIDYQSWPPFELREIEHSLCEFDKYQRVKTGVGRPREKFDGR